MSEQNTDGLPDDGINYKSISCEQIPEQFLDKTIAKEHFSQFGAIRRFILRPKRYACTVDYETAEAAENALMDGGVFNNYEFRVFFTPKETPKPKILDDYMDPDVQAELEAMGSVKTFSSPVTSQKVERRMKLGPKVPEVSGMKTSPGSSLPTVNPTTRAEIEALLRKPAFTAEEKYRVLDARDKLLRMTTTKTLDIRKAEATKGTCPDMCPEKERHMREAKKQVAEFEKDFRGNLCHKLAMKQYSRSSADQESTLPHELRPEPVLRMTMNYLLCEIVDLCDMEDVNTSDWFHFLWDRTRSIRKDITQQELCSQDSVVLVEQCARFHIHCSARLIAEDPSVFDQKINTENLTKCLQSLKYMYHDLALKGEMCPNEAEFRGYIILLNLQDSNFLWEVKQLPVDVQKSEAVRFAIEVFLAMEANNYVRFFQLVRKTTYMNACILLRYFNQVRARALEVIVKAFTTRGSVAYSLRHLMYILAFEDANSAALFCEYYGLAISMDEDEVTLNKNSFYYPDMPFLLDRAISVVEHKLETSAGEAIGKCSLDSRESFENYQPQNSFDDRGFLIDKLVKVRDEPDAVVEKVENIFKIPSGSPPISPKQFYRPHRPEETTPPRFHLPEPKNVFSSLLPVTSSPIPVVRPQPFSLAFKPQTPSVNIFGGMNAALTAVSPPSGLFAEAAKKTQEEHQERLRREKEADEKRKREEEEEKRRREEEDELERERERLKREMLRSREIDKVSRQIQEEIIEEIVEETSEEIAEEEIISHRDLLLNVEEVAEEITREVVEELAERTICEEYIVARRLLLLKYRSLAKCFTVWRNFAAEKINRRNIIQNTPIWLPSEPLEAQVESFRHPHQDATIALKSRYRRGVPDDLDLSRIPTNCIDLFAEIGQIFLSQARKSKERRILKTNHWWKLLVSIPDDNDESPGFTGYITKWLDEIFLRSKENKDKNFLFVEQKQVKNCQENLAVSVQVVRGTSNNTDFAHGIIFFLTVGNLENSRKRLKQFSESDLPMAFIVYNGHSVTEQEVEQSLDLQLTQYLLRIYDENRRRSSTSLSEIFQESLKFCARNYNFDQGLEMMKTSVFLDETLGSVFWKRLHLSAQVNPKLSAISHNINFVITLYNQAVKRIRRFSTSDTFNQYPDFPEEFRQFVPPRLGESFITWEHFPQDWRSESRLKKFNDFLTKLILPPFTFSGQIFSSKDIEKELRNYLTPILPPESLNRVTYGIMEPLLATEINESISWLRPVEIIVLERLTVAFRKAELPQDFVYEHETIDEYIATPWWLTDDLVGAVPVQLDEAEPAVKKRRQEEPLDLNDVLKKADKSLVKADEKLQKRQKIVTASCEISRELDTKLMQQEENHRQLSRKWRERLSQ